MIPFNNPCVSGNEINYIAQSIVSGKISGDGEFTKKCHRWFEAKLGCEKALLTTSCTHALEMAAILINIQPGDEIIMPSYTFVSTANAFVLRGAKVIFVDIRPDTMNIDEKLIEAAITPKTKAIVPVHYAGVACEMDTIMALAGRYDLFVIEDAAQAMMSTYKGKALGSIGHLGTYSFHETKNYTSGGEGGLLIINDKQFAERAEIIREKGTNRGQFFRGMVDKYTWVDIGSSYLPSELQSAYLYAQLEMAGKILESRLLSWNQYYQGLLLLSMEGKFELPNIPQNCDHNAHMFYIKLKNLSERTSMINYLKAQGINSAFHYLPLHNSEYAIKQNLFSGALKNTEQESEKILRLPLFYGLQEQDVTSIVHAITSYYKCSEV